MVFTCSRCNKILKSEYLLKKHFNRKIPCIKIIQCSKCFKTFIHNQNLTTHLNRKTPCVNPLNEISLIENQLENKNSSISDLQLKKLDLEDKRLELEREKIKSDMEYKLKLEEDRTKREEEKFIREMEFKLKIEEEKTKRENEKLRQEMEFKFKLEELKWKNQKDLIEKKIQSKQINITTNTQNNFYINNMEFDNEKMVDGCLNQPTLDPIKKCIGQSYKETTTNIIQYFYNNDDFPHNKNIIYPNKVDNIFCIYVDNSWKEVKFKTIIQPIIYATTTTLDYLITKNTINKFLSNGQLNMVELTQKWINRDERLLQNCAKSALNKETYKKNQEELYAIMREDD